MSDGDWDVWLLGFEPGAESTRGLVDLFGMTEAAAQHIEMTVPRAMKRKLPEEEARNMLAALERIGAKAELRRHRGESARRSVSRPKMEAVRDPAPPPVSAAPQPGTPVAAPAETPAAAPAPPAATETGPKTSPEASQSQPPATPPKRVELPLGAPVAELSKTPRNVFLAIVGVLALVTVIAVAMSFTGGGGEEIVLGPVDIEAQSLIADGSMDLRAFLSNPAAGFSGNERADIQPFIDACYTAGARRLMVADIEDIWGEKYAHALLVELPETEAGAEAIRNASQELLSEQASGVEVGNRWLIARFSR